VSLSTISVAALLVKVSSKISCGATFELRRCAIRPTIVDVFPVPADAITMLRPDSAVAAFNCSSFKRLNGIIIFRVQIWSFCFIEK